MKSIAITLAALLISGVAAANSSDKFGHDEVKFDPQKFAAQQKKLTHEVKTAERYAELSSSDRMTVLNSLASLDDLMRGVSAIDELNKNEKLRVFNLQETVNTLLTDAAAGSRLVCARETKTGTHRSTNVCKTVAQREREREVSVAGMERNRHAPRLPTGEPTE